MKHESHVQRDTLPKKSATPSAETAPSSKEVIMLGTGLLFLTVSIGGMLMLSEDEPLHAKASRPLDMKQVSQAFHSPVSSTSSDGESSSVSSPSATLVSFEQETLSTVNASSPNEMDVYFGFDQATLSEDAKIIIQETLDIYQENQGGSLTVQGHADQHGSDTYNQALSLRRAKAVKAYLIAQGVDETSINLESFGSRSNICTEDSEDCLQKNRRAHVIISADQLSASVVTPLVTELAETESENLVTEESETSVTPLSEKEAPTTTALLSEAVEEISTIESTTSPAALP
ncbi:MAG: OmpA family protein [Nitrospirales bacterium]